MDCIYVIFRIFDHFLSLKVSVLVHCNCTEKKHRKQAKCYPFEFYRRRWKEIHTDLEQLKGE